MTNEVLNFTNALRQTQWFSAEEILDLQIPQLERLVRHAVAQTDGYAARLAPAFNGDAFNFDRWQEIPILTRVDIQDNQPRYRAREVPGPSGAIIKHATSGSTGRPLEFIKSELMVRGSHAMMERMYDWAGCDRDLSFFALVPDAANSPIDPLAHYRTGWSAIGGTGARTQMDARNPVNLFIHELQKSAPHYLQGMPNMIAAIIRETTDFSWARNLKAIFCYSEAVREDFGQLVAEKLAVPVFDNYASEESGGIAVRCPASHHHHIAAEMTYVEVLRHDGAPCLPGETGRVIVTPLYNLALPLIRYDQGDMVTLPLRACPCGRGLPSFSRIIGRQRDMFVTPSGSRVIARLPISEILPYIAASQWQMVQHNIHDIEFKYVRLDPQLLPDVAGLEARLAASLGFAINLTVTAVTDIAKTASGKFRETVCLIDTVA